MPERRAPAAPPSADEIRALVRRIVDATLDAEAAHGASSGPGATDDRAVGAPGPAAGITPSPPASAAARTTGDGARVVVAIGADHGGFALKERIGRWLVEHGYEVRDCGTHGTDAVDYPDFAHVVARLVAGGACRWGIVVDGAGIGSAMVAGKVPGVRAANCHDVSSARNSREHNHANVLTLGAGFLGERLALEVVEAWLATEWGPGRHAARVAKITDVERRYLGQPDGGRAG